MPRADRAPTEPTARVPRTLFAHGHEQDQVDIQFPPNVNVLVRSIQLLPDNWNGVDKLVLWFLPSETWTDVPFNLVANAGSCGEAKNIHTQTLANHTITAVANVYHCEDLTTEFAVFIALLNSRDMIQIDIHDTWGMGGVYIGLEIQET